jgi:hypothetical protein
MRIIILYVFALILFILSSCEDDYNNRHPVRIWDNYPSQKFFSYIKPYQIGKEITFISDNGELFNTKINSRDTLDTFVLTAVQEFLNSDGLWMNFHVHDKSMQDNNFGILGTIWNMYYMSVSVEINLPLGRFEARFSKTIAYDENFMPYNPDSIADCVKDTLILYNQQNQPVANIVSGKGLVSFTDESGVEWQLVE